MKEKVFSAKKFMVRNTTTFKKGGIEFLISKTDIITDLVTIKNMSNGKKKDIDYYKLKEITG